MRRTRSRRLALVTMLGALSLLGLQAAPAAAAGQADLSFSGSVRGELALPEIGTWVSSAGAASWCLNGCRDSLTMSLGSSGKPARTGPGVVMALNLGSDGVAATSVSGECTFDFTTFSDDVLEGRLACRNLVNASTGRTFNMRGAFAATSVSASVPIAPPAAAPQIPSGPVLPTDGSEPVGSTASRPTGSVTAAQGTEHISNYRTEMTIRADGTLLVKETIAYDFANTPNKHGIFRDIPDRLRYDADDDRLYPIEVVSVTASGGASAKVAEERAGALLRLRIGDGDRTVTGEVTYVITYEVQGAMNGFAEHDELYWNAIGDQWEVPIEKASATVEAPAGIERATCYAGSTGSTSSCTSSKIAGERATFTQNGLFPYEAFTVVVALPKGAVPEPAPILKERWTFEKAFSVTPATAGGAAGVAALAIGGVGWLVWREGRDRRARGDAVAVAFATQEIGEQDQTRVGMFEPKDSPVEFAPPADLRPGQVGTLVDETANPLDVTATIIDLASRGYLRIEEVPKEGLFGKDDWRLVQLKAIDDLLTYERVLMNGLFAAGSEVLLSSLRQAFAERMAQVQESLYVDAVANGWFRGRPDHVRTKWLLIGIGSLVLSAGVLVLAAMFTKAALIAVPLVLGALALAIAARWMPARTAKGTGVLRRVNGFRIFIEDSEAIRAKFYEDNNIFTEYLPYAVVFGATKKWAKAFEGLEDQISDSTGWYVSRHPFVIGSFVSSMDGFAVSSAGTLTSTPGGSGGSGFGGGGGSGGGGGGGGGGSW